MTLKRLGNGYAQLIDANGTVVLESSWGWCLQTKRLLEG